MTRSRLTVVAMLLSTSCSSADLGNLADQSRPITDGVEEMGYPEVCALVDPVDELIFCSCTYVGASEGTGPRVVTAAHCVHDRAATEMRVAFGHQETGWDEVIVATAAVAHPDYSPTFSNARPSDIAYVELEHEPNAILPKPINDVSPATADSMLWTHIGFGASHKQYLRIPGRGPYNWAGYGLKRSVSIPTTVVSDPRGEYDYPVSDLDGDGVGEDTCYGDSGGPAMALFGGVERLVGVTSRGAADCLKIDSISIDTRVDTFVAFLRSPVPVPPVPVCDSDGTCEAGEDCQNCRDCEQRTSGRLSGRFCCGDGIAQSGEADGAVCDGNF